MTAAACAECDRQDYDAAHPWRAAARSVCSPVFGLLLILLCPPAPPPFNTAVLRAMTGATEPSHYERHRRAWIATGELRELDRMLRQVRPG